MQVTLTGPWRTISNNIKRDARYPAQLHRAHSPSKLKLRNIRQCLYRGFCLSNDGLPQTIALFNGRKQDILDLFRTEPRLDEHDREKAIRCIEDFYAVVNDPAELERQVIDKCRGSVPRSG